MTPFSDACAALQEALSTDVRRDIVAEAARSKSFDRAARRLRDGMRLHRFEAAGRSLFTGRFVKQLDDRTREDGFHALHDWDGKADRFNDDSIPVEVANFAERMVRPGAHASGVVALKVLLDYYFLHLLGLLTLRAWDAGDPNTNMDAITRLLGDLQGPEGSGHLFARRAETLLLIATSHFEPDVRAYDGLLLKVQRLDNAHRLNLATIHAAILGCHLRFGLEVTCAGSISALRDDNLPDYPWLCDAVATLLEAYGAARERGADAQERATISEAILLGLLPDPDLFLTSPPASSADRRSEARALLASHRSGLLHDFTAHRPTDDSYSPLAFTFNFPHNLVKGSVVDAAIRGTPWRVTLDDLLTAFPRSADLDSARRLLATTLMRYALASPDTIRGRPHPAIVYHPDAARRAFDRTLSGLQA